MARRRRFPFAVRFGVWDALNPNVRDSRLSVLRVVFAHAVLPLRCPLEPAPMPSVSLKELIEFIARALVDNPDEVTVSEISGEQTIVLELRVAKEDLGKVIGKQGRTVKAMRAILSAASSKVRKRADLEILE
jgi:hypothetical protein